MLSLADPTRFVRWFLVLLPGLIFVAGGCSRGQETYPVEGKIVWQDGSEAKELAGGVITLDSLTLKVSATGQIGPDASFRLGTYGASDGVPAGVFNVAVTRPPEAEAAGTWVPLPRKYESVASSDLKLQIEPKKNVVKVEIEKLKRKK